MDSDNDASEEDMKVRYTYIMPKESDVSVEFNSVKTLLFENQIEDISKTLHQVRKELGIKEGEELDDPNMLLNAFLDLSRAGGRSKIQPRQEEGCQVKLGGGGGGGGSGSFKRICKSTQAIAWVACWDPPAMLSSWRFC